MKRTTLLITVCVLVMQSAFAGGILTNANQSAQYVRMLSRNASTELDAVYFNPAGLTLLDDGFYFGLHNQTIFQERTITSGLPMLNESVYSGDVKAPVFPTAFAAYKKNDWVFSFGFGPNGGGGTAEYGTGIPTFEKKLALLPAGISALGIPTSAYNANLYLDGSSVFWGLQLNASYQLSEVFSASVGLRYIDAVNKYQGYIKDVMINPQHPLINPTGGFMKASDFFTAVGDMENAEKTSDIETDTKQTGRGYTPILGANLFLDRLNIGMKYEFKTTLTLANETVVDGTGFFTDGEKSPSDIPAIFAIGADYMLTDDFKASLSFNNYFDKAVDWRTNVYGDDKTFVHNYFEIALGFEYALTDAFKLSVGGMHSNTGVTEQYQSDFSYSNSSFTGAFGFQYKISDRLVFDAGFLYTTYLDEEKTFTDPIEYIETYDKKNLDFAFGIAYKLF